MTEAEFRDLMRELTTAYGKRPEQFSEALVEQYRQVCRPIEPGDRLYRECLRTFKWFPTVSELHGLAGRYRAQGARVSNISRCFYCMDVGTIEYTRKGLPPFTDTEYSFRAACPRCEAGRVYGGAWPQYDQIFSVEALEALRVQNCAEQARATTEQTQQDELNARMTPFGALVGKPIEGKMPENDRQKQEGSKEVGLEKRSN